MYKTPFTGDTYRFTLTVDETVNNVLSTIVTQLQSRISSEKPLRIQIALLSTNARDKLFIVSYLTKKVAEMRLRNVIIDI